MKKGILPLWMSFFFALLAVLLLLLFYFLVVRGDKAPQEVAIRESFAVTAHHALLGYLDAPVAVQGETVTFADLIRLWHRDRNAYEPLLRSATYEFLVRNDFKYRDIDGDYTRALWLSIYDVPKDNPQAYTAQFLLRQELFAHPSERAEVLLPVSSTEAVRVVMWSART